MKTIRKCKIIVPFLLMLFVMSGCRVGAERYELTNYIGKSVATFEKRAGAEMENLSNGVYVVKGAIQFIAPEGNITSITLLKNAEEYTVFGVSIGMSKADAEPKLGHTFGKEISKTINSTNNAVTYLYVDSTNELYISFDLVKETVVELSYYKLDIPEEEQNVANDVNAGELMIMVGDSRVYYNEVMVYLKSAQENYEAEFGKDIWNADIFNNGKTFGGLLKDEIVNQITELKIIRNKAKEMDVTLSEEELAEAKRQARIHYEGLADKDIDRYLVTEGLLEQIYADNILAEKMFETLTINVDTNVSDLDAKQITVQHIMIYGIDIDENGNKIPLTVEEKEQAFDKIKTLHAQAIETNDFYALAEANTKADVIEYTFGRGQGPKNYSTAFEQAAFTLRTGEVSDIISTDYGWHILYCVSDFNEDATTQVKEHIIEQRRNKMFSELYTEWSVNYDVVVNSEAWNAISFEE